MNPEPPLLLRVLGQPTLLFNGAVRTLPPSRKTRALLAYLALEGHAVTREHLCDLFWPSAASPRAALRWSLAQLRPLLATPSGQALVADAHAVALDGGLIAADVRMLARELEGASEITQEALLSIESAMSVGLSGDFDLDLGHRYTLWLAGEREALRRLHRATLDTWAKHAPGPDLALDIARKRAALDPFDCEANLQYLTHSIAVDGHDRARLALHAMRDRYRAEGLPDHALMASWRGLLPGEDLELPDKPSVAVLGFANLGDHPDGGVLSEGLAADLTLALGRFKGLFVSARASAARFSVQANDPAHVGRMLGVRYLVHGSTQRLARRVRVTVSLTDARTSTAIWGEHFDRSLGDLFAIQDDVSIAIASAIEPAIARAEAERAGLCAPEDLTAWGCYHRAMWHCYRFTARHTELAHALLQQALALDKGFARAHAGLSFTHYSRAFLDATPAPELAVAQALEHGQRSIELDAHDALGHWMLGRAQFLAREHDRAMHAVDLSVRINPSFAQGHYALGFLEAHSGLPTNALLNLAAAERLSPLDPLLFAVEGARAISLAIDGHYASAAAWGVRATAEPNAHFHIHAIAGACLALAGRQKEAKSFAQRALLDHPGYSLQTFERSFPQKNVEHQLLLHQAMRSSGIPEGSA